MERAVSCSGAESAIEWWHRPFTSGVPCRFVLSLILVVAASFKAFELLADPSIGILHGSRHLYAALAVFEVLLATWLISGIYSRTSRAIAFITFSAFWLVALYHTFTQASSCGCFGSVAISPWIMLTVDSTALVLLWAWDPGCGATHAFCKEPPRAVGSIAIVIAILAYISLVSLGSQAGPGTNLRVLDPAKWIGQRFPLLSETVGVEGLSRGRWTIVLYHHDCPDCQAVLASYNQVGITSDTKTDPKVALIEVPPYGPVTPDSTGHVTYGQLVATYEWFVRTPTKIELRDGVVLSAGLADDASDEKVVVPFIEPVEPH